MSSTDSSNTVLITDYAWPDLSIEKEIIEGAGFKLVAGPADAAPAEHIEALMQEHQPVGLLFNWAPVSETAINNAPNLKCATRLGVGLDNLPVEMCTQKGIWVTNVPDYCVEEVSDHAVGMLLSWARGLFPLGSQVQNGEWNPAGARLRRVSELTVGIIGYGRIGQRTAEKLRPFNCRLVAYDRSPDEDDIEFCSLESLAKQSDVMIVHLPLAPTTQHLINPALLEQTKRGSLLINVGRGGVVDTDAAISALNNGTLSAVALDVLEDEPNVPEELKTHPGNLITPHVAFSSDASLVELRKRACEDLIKALRGDAPEQARNNPIFT